MYAKLQTLRWAEFMERLCGSDGCNWQESTWTCFGDHRFSRKILAGMGLPPVAVERYITYFKSLGGYCDCEVILLVHGRHVALSRSRRAPMRGKGRR